MAIPDEPDELRRLAATFGGLAHPIRLSILAALRDGEPMSPKQLCACVSPSTSLPNLAHHTRGLAAVGALDPAGTRYVRGAVEHFYRLSPWGRVMVELADSLSRDDRAAARIGR